MEDLLADVYENPPLASIGSRLGAAFIDLVLVITFFAVLGYFWGEHYINEEGGSGLRLSGLPALAWFSLCFLIMPLQEGLTGKTIGKRVMGLKVVRKDYSDGGVGASIVRHLFDVVDMFFLAGIIVAATNPLRQRVGDLVAGTIVIKG